MTRYYGCGGDLSTRSMGIHEVCDRCWRRSRDVKLESRACNSEPPRAYGCTYRRSAFSTCDGSLSLSVSSLKLGHPLFIYPRWERVLMCKKSKPPASGIRKRWEKRMKSERLLRLKRRRMPQPLCASCADKHLWSTFRYQSFSISCVHLNYYFCDTSNIVSFFFLSKLAACFDATCDRKTRCWNRSP
jgi:hypothetical protein